MIFRHYNNKWRYTDLVYQLKNKEDESSNWEKELAKVKEEHETTLDEIQESMDEVRTTKVKGSEDACSTKLDEVRK